MYHAISRKEVFHGRKYDSRWGLAARRLHGEVHDSGFPGGHQPRLVHFHRPLGVGLYSSWQLPRFIPKRRTLDYLVNASQNVSDIIGYLVWVFTPHSCHRVKSRISRRLTSPRKFRRAVLCTSRMSRCGAGPCALRLSCVSPRGLNLVFGSSSASTGLYPTATGPLLLSAFSFLTGVSPVTGEVEFPFSLLRILLSSTTESSPPSP